VKATEEMAAAGKIRLRGAGAFDAKTGQRGDLYVNLSFVDRLNEAH
jgi:DnaJ-class molecular chaperone